MLLGAGSFRWGQLHQQLLGEGEERRRTVKGAFRNKVESCVYCALLDTKGTWNDWDYSCCSGRNNLVWSLFTLSGSSSDSSLV